ncbi:MAG TPA: hypothetical protein VFW83_00620 [Bryobacteraceae bacterium]|nr:hypothetical protein [Bryobacteraceae bacterium]
MLPRLEGRPIRILVRSSLGSNLAAASIPRRTVFLDSAVLRQPGDFERILVHELFHFVWVRLSNGLRREWEQVLARELAQGAPGELGWSAEWRKNKLTPAAIRRRSPAWRRYACESFCDTAAWRFAGLERHEEFTLPARFRRLRVVWFKRCLEQRNLPV